MRSTTELHPRVQTGFLATVILHVKRFCYHSGSYGSEKEPICQIQQGVAGLASGIRFALRREVSESIFTYRP